MVAAVIPIGLSILAVGAGIGAITLLASGMTMSVSAVPVAALVGLGVGVDYALFVVARYRENRTSGQDNQRASNASHPYVLLRTRSHAGKASECRVTAQCPQRTPLPSTIHPPLLSSRLCHRYALRNSFFANTSSR